MLCLVFLCWPVAECLFTIPGSGQDASQKQRSNRQEEDDDDEGFMEGADEKLDALTNAGGRPEGYDSHSRTTGSEKTTRDADTDSVQDVESTAASDDEVKELSPEEKLRERHTREEAVQRDAARRLRRKYDFVAGRMKTPVLKMAPSTPLVSVYGFLLPLPLPAFFLFHSKVPLWSMKNPKISLRDKSLNVKCRCTDKICIHVACMQ